MNGEVLMTHNSFLSKVVQLAYHTSTAQDTAVFAEAGHSVRYLSRWAAYGSEYWPFDFGFVIRNQKTNCLFANKIKKN